MEDEELCEVDEWDRVIGPRARGEVHRLGLRHRAVHILVYNPVGEVFLQKRSLSKDVNPGFWDTSAAGHVDFGESYEATAHRELREELGIAGATLSRLGKIPAGPATGNEFVEVYGLLHAGELRPNPEEIDDGRWFRVEAIDAWIAAGGAELTLAFQAVWAVARGCPETASG